jgi:hypothetical protein
MTYYQGQVYMDIELASYILHVRRVLFTIKLLHKCFHYLCFIGHDYDLLSRPDIYIHIQCLGYFIVGLFCCICSFLLFVWLFFFTYALLSVVYVSMVYVWLPYTIIICLINGYRISILCIAFQTCFVYD